MVTHLRVPQGENVRVDTALCVGYEVSLHYEPLLAKVMAWGEERAAAIATLDAALADFHVAGVNTNIPLLRDVLASPEFTSGEYHTGSLAYILERRQQANSKKSAMHRNPIAAPGHQPANGQRPELDPRALAAAIGAAAVAVAQAEQQNGSALSEGGSRWRTLGRRELFRSRLGSASW